MTDYMYQEKKEEEDLLALTTALTHRYNDYLEKRGGRLITVTRNNTGNTRPKLENKNGKKNNFMEVLNA